ncbi:MAG: hypothetical protein WC975_09115 [Phycisphaerae bacterium]
MHWDLMLHRPGKIKKNENEKILAVWKLSVCPVPEKLNHPLSITALPDHRKAYLTYEGPISQNRGWCKIFDRGDYELVESRPDFWRVRFAGKHLSGRFVLQKIDGPDTWTLTKAEPTG